jgi:DNA-binding CsgD family transcriptional regulator
VKEFLDRFVGNISASAIMTSVFFWSWFDLVPFSTLVGDVAGAGSSPLGLAASMAVSVVTLLVYASSRRLLEHALSPWGFAAACLLAGSLGTALTYAGSLTGSAPLLAVATMLVGVFEGAGIATIGPLITCQGKTNALVHMAVCLPVNIVFVLLGLFLQPKAGVALCILLPMLSALSFVVYLNRGRNDRTIRQALTPAGSARRPTGRRRELARYATVLLLVTVSFGVVNVATQFSAGDGAGWDRASFVPLVIRAAAAASVFLAYVFWSRQPYSILIAALTLMVLGLLVLGIVPAASRGSAPAPYWVVVAGYAVFDLLIWAMIVIVHRGSGAPLARFVCLAYALDQLGNCVGTVLGIGLAVLGGDALALGCGALGALVALSALVTLSGPGAIMGDLRTVVVEPVAPAQGGLASSQGACAPTPPTGGAAAIHEDSVSAIGSRYFLTEREREILSLLVAGRTVPFISEQLGVSQNTVKTHVRHIYAKLDIHDRQELIDLASEPQDMR